MKNKKFLKLFKSSFILAPFISGIVSFAAFLTTAYFLSRDNGQFEEYLVIGLIVFIFTGLASLAIFFLSFIIQLYLLTQTKGSNNKFGHLMLGFVLLGILNIAFFLGIINFLISADGLSFDEKAAIGGQNMWRVVFFYGFFTSVFVFISFWRKFFRGVAVTLIIFWVLGTGMVGVLNNSKFSGEASVTNANDKIVTESSQCIEKNTIDEAKYCTTLIIRDDGAHGSAFSIYDGYLVTNKHVIEGAKKLVTYIGEDEYPATLWNYSPSYDLAILKIPDGLGTCKWFDSKNMQVAETVYTVGWPLDTFGESTVAKGIYSRMLESEEGSYIQTDASINPGNSGGPLINKCGVVGINTAKIEEVGVEGLGFVLPSSELIPVVEQLINEGSETTIIPLANNEYVKNYVPPDTQQYVIYVDEVQSHLNSLVAARRSWENCRNCSQEDLSRLLDSFDRQISFCRTLIDRLNSSKKPSQDDIFMWDTIVKLSYESAAIAARLNSR